MRPGLLCSLDSLLSFPRSVRGKTVVKWSKSVDPFKRRPLTRRKTFRYVTISLVDSSPRTLFSMFLRRQKSLSGTDASCSC
jgi:hypothetical protein